MNKNKFKLLLLTFISLQVMMFSCQLKSKKENLSLKNALSNKFLIGAALNTPQIQGNDTSSVKIITTHFNSVVAENCMKSEIIQPKKGEFDFALADQFVEFGESNNMFVIGHTLIWHSQLAGWFFVDDEGNDVNREELIERMKNHIYTVVGRYKGRVKGWDVVNEAILDDGSFRQSKFYNIIGEEYIKLAFQFAHEADPDAQLYYNDYSMTNAGKRDGVVNMVKSLQEQGVRIDGVGMQAHCTMNYPLISEFEKSILAFSDLGVQVMITELDISAIPSPFEIEGADVASRFDYKESMDPYKDGMPDSVQVAFNKRYMDFFKLFLQHKEKIQRVTVWGVNDNQSWRNYWPIKGRTDYPLLFDRQNKAKSIVNEIIKAANAVE